MSESKFNLLGIGVGTLLAGRYEIEDVLGKGGMAAVFGVRDKALGRELVALKILDPRLCEDDVDVERFKHEVLISRRLTHPSIVRTFEFGQLESGESFVVMEHIKGKSLERLLEEQPSGLPLDLFVPYLIGVARGMHYAHQNGVVHRDLKPGNILIGEDGSVKIADFGLARSKELQAKLTQAGECVGTPMYMAPEQITGQGSDHRVDIYGLGVIAYELFTGSSPYSPETWFKLASQIVSQPLPKLNKGRGRAPAWLEEFVERAAAKSPEARFQTMEEAAAFLESNFQAGSAETKRGRFAERLADGLGEAVRERASAVVMVGVALFALVASIGYSKGSMDNVQTQVQTGTNAVGKVVDTLQKLNKVVMTTYENADKIDRFLDEEARRKREEEAKGAPQPQATQGENPPPVRSEGEQAELPAAPAPAARNAARPK